MCLHYAKNREASIKITHKPLKGDQNETLIPYFCTRSRDLHPPKGFREETIAVEVFASADCNIIDDNIETALTAINLDVKGKIHQPSMGKECPVTSNKRIVHVVPPGHTSKGGKWTLNEAADMFEWPRNLRVQMVFDDGEPQPAPIHLRYNIYGDGSNTELKLCKICHKKDGHANDCEYGKKSVDKMQDYTRKLKLKTNKTTTNRANGTCSDYASFRHNASCNMTKECHQA